MSFGRLLQAARKKANMSQTDLAEKLGVTRITISIWERDRSSPTLKFAVEAAQILNFSLEALNDPTNP